MGVPTVPMGAPPRQLRWTVRRKDVSCCCRCLLQMDGGYSHDYSDLHNHNRWSPCNVFTTHGIPQVFVTDNGAQYTSAEFKTFMEDNGNSSSPFSSLPSGNKRVGQTCSTVLQEEHGEEPDRNYRLSSFAIPVSVLPHSTYDHLSTTS